MAELDIALAGGVDPDPSYGQQNKFTFAGTWLAGELWSVSFSSTTGDFTIGANFTLGIQFADWPFNFCFTFANRVYLGGDKQYNFSSIFDPTDPLHSGPYRWHEQDSGAGYVLFLSQLGPQDNVQSFAVFQGRLVVFGQQSIQIWSADADPANFSLIQTLGNTGTIAPLSVQSLGDYDVIYLDSDGVRSLRAKETSLNAFSVDIGTPIDAFVRAAIASADVSGSCSVVEPEAKRYWVFVKDRIYVLSYFRESKIVAWSTYECVDDSGVAFVPEKFVVFNRQVFIKTTDGRLIRYGGPDGNSYDYSVPIVETAYMDHRTPAMYKQARSINYAITGSWKLEVSMEPKTDKMQLIRDFPNQNPPGNPVEAVDSTYDEGVVPYAAHGTHFKFRFTGSNKQNTPAKVSSLVFSYEASKHK